MNAREPLVRGKAYHAWRELAIAGFVLTLLMVVDGFVDVFRDIRVLDFETVILGIPLGMAIMYAGCIGWARYLIREKRFGITVILVVPWLLLAAFDRMGVQRRDGQYSGWHSRCRGCHRSFGDSKKNGEIDRLILFLGGVRDAGGWIAGGE